MEGFWFEVRTSRVIVGVAVRVHILGPESEKPVLLKKIMEMAGAGACFSLDILCRDFKEQARMLLALRDAIMHKRVVSAEVMPWSDQHGHSILMQCV